MSSTIASSLAAATRAAAAVAATPTPTPRQPPLRAEYERQLPPLEGLAPSQPLPWLHRVWGVAAVRRTVILAVLAAAWQVLALWQDNELLLPSFTATVQALVDDALSGELLSKAGISLAVLVQGYLLGIAGALLLTTLAVSTQLGRDLLTTLTSMLNPLPAIALLPLALLWFGLGQGSLLFVLVHSVLWPLALNTYAGFQAVPETLRMAGRNYGLSGVRYVLQILIPAALPAILSGLKIAWAFAWRTLIAAELVFGASSGKGGLGWYIFQNRNELYTDKVFAGLLTVIAIGLLVETLGFHTLERLTVRKWGAQR
jgi:NitT/TauT family transport system permease protein